MPAAVPPGNPERKFQHEVRDIFVDQGFTEVYNYSFLSEESVRAFGLDPAAHVRVTNPIASDQALMRTSLLPGIWQNIVENAKHRDAFRLFEIGLEIHRQRCGPARRRSRTWWRRSTTATAMARPACSKSSARPSA